jgi:hypothetical protein
MAGMPLAHVSWAIADNKERKPCDNWVQDTFGGEPIYEMLMTPEAEAMGLDREETLTMIGDTMVIPIAPAPSGPAVNSPTGDMLRRSAGLNRWLGVALKVHDLKATAAAFEAKGFKLHYDPGMEEIYFLVGRKQALGVRLEVMAHDLPNDPRLVADWSPQRWRDEHPLGIEGLQSIGVSTPSLDVARECFGARLEWPEIGSRTLPGEDAECVCFDMGDTVIEAMAPSVEDSELARHLRETQGIYCLTFKVKSAAAAADYLSGKGFELIGDVATRFAIRPDQAFGRTIWFTANEVAGYPPLGSRIFKLEATAA